MKTSCPLAENVNETPDNSYGNCTLTGIIYYEIGDSGILCNKRYSRAGVILLQCATL